MFQTILNLFLLFQVSISSHDQYSTNSAKASANLVTEQQRLHLLQIDAAATGTIMPSSDPALGELTWSLSPSKRATIQETGKWIDLPDNQLAFTLTRESHVIVKYHMVVVANQPHHAGGDFINAGQSSSTVVSDFLGARLLLDGMPYRQSGSHAAPLSALEISTRQMSGYIVTRLGAGKHIVTLQWRKWGNQVGSWQVSPILHDGFIAGRSLTVTSQPRYLWFAQPLSVARTVVSSTPTWSVVRDMEISFALPRKWPLRFVYTIQVSIQAKERASRNGSTVD